MLAFGTADDASAQAGSKPNIIYILADDLGLGDVSAYNSTNINLQTTHIDSLAANGMRFTNAHSPSAVCSPTRYGIMTGDHPFRAGLANRVQFNYGDVWLDQSERTIANVLQGAGYTTGMVGKWHLGYDVYDSNGQRLTGSVTNQASLEPDWSRGVDNTPSDHGFDYSYGHTSSADIPLYKWYENGQWVNSGAASTGETYWLNTSSPGSILDSGENGSSVRMQGNRSGWADSDWDFNQVMRREQDKAVEFINNNAGAQEPFFLYLPLSGPHTPYAPHPDYQNATGNVYTNFVKETDELVGSVVSALEAQGVLKDTLIILTSDNGADSRGSNFTGHQGTGYAPDGTPLRGQKGDAWEGGTNVPFIAQWGDGTNAGSTIQRGVTSDELISLTDFFQTAAGLAGATVAENEAVDSWNILPALLSDGTDQGIHEANITTSLGGTFSITQKDENGNEWKLIFQQGSGGGFSSFGGVEAGYSSTNPNQNFENLTLSDLQLYNLTSDPCELTNLLIDGVTAEESSIVEGLHGLMRDYIVNGRSAPVQPVPEPTSALVLGAGCLLLLRRARNK